MSISAERLPLYEDNEYRVYEYRWVVLAAFGLVLAVQAFLWLSFAPIEGSVQVALGIGATKVRLLALVGPFMYIFLASPAGSLADRRGFKFSAVLGVVLLAAAGAVKAVAPHLISGGNALYWTFFLMQMLGGASAMLLLVNLSKMPIKWFAERQRVLATGLATMGMYLGTAAALPLVTSVADLPQRASREAALAGMERVLLVVACLMAASAVLFILLAREEPPTAAGPVPEQEVLPLLKALSRFMRSATFRALCVISFFGYGVYVAAIVTMEKIITFHGRGFSTSFASLVAAGVTIGGIVGSAVLPGLSEKYGKRKPFLVMAGGVCIPGLLLVALVPDKTVEVLAAVVTGFFLLPALPITFTIVGEMEEIGPRLAGTAVGTLMALGSVGSVLIPLLMEVFARKKAANVVDYRVSLLVLAAIGVVSLFVMLRYVRETGPGARPS